MSHQQPAVFQREDSDDEEFFDASDFLHDDETAQHDQNVLSQSNPASPPLSASTERDHETQSDGEDTCHDPSAPTGSTTEEARSTPNSPSPSPPPRTTQWPRPPSPPPAPSSASTYSATVFGSSAGETPVEGSQDSYVKPLFTGWKPSFGNFGASHSGEAIESPISPLTVRTTFPPGASDCPSKPVVGPAPLSQVDLDANFEGVSLPTPVFSRPRSKRSSAGTTVRCLPALLRPTSRPSPAAFLFADPFAPPPSDSPPTLRLHSIRHILESDDGDREPIPDVSQDSALINHLEIVQVEAANAWEKAHGAPGQNEQERADQLAELVRTMFRESVNFLGETLRSRKMVRYVARNLRLALNELDRVRKLSNGFQEDAQEKEHDLTLDLTGLREENRTLRTKLRLRQFIAAADEAREKSESLALGEWLGNLDDILYSHSSVPKNIMDVNGEDMPDMTPVAPGEKLPKDFTPEVEHKPWLDRLKKQRRESWEPDHDKTDELLQKIAQLRDRIDHEEFEKEAAQELAGQLEKELDIAMGIGAHQESTSVKDARDKATKRRAEKVALQAALKTSQQNYETQMAECAVLHKRLDELEEQIVERDHKISQDAETTTNLLNGEQEARRAHADAEFRCEDLTKHLAEIQEQLKVKTAEVSRLEAEIRLAIDDLKAAEAELGDLRPENETLKEDLYNEQTRVGDLIQDVEFEKQWRAIEKAELERGQGELAETKAMYDECQLQYDELVREYDDLAPQHEAKQKELRDKVRELEGGLIARAGDIFALEDQCQRLRLDVSSSRHVSKELALYIKSMRGEEGQRQYEALIRRCAKLEKQRAAWRCEYQEVAGKRRRAEMRYHKAHRVLAKERRELEERRQRNDLDAEWEKKLMEIIYARQLECEVKRLEHQDLQQRLASAEQMEKAHGRGIDDVEGFLKAFGGDGTKGIEKPGDQTNIDLGNTALPPPPPVIREKIVTKTIEHHHSEACFCSLVDYWFPGVLDKVLPARRPDTGDSGYGSGGSSDEPAEAPGLGRTPRSHDKPVAPVREARGRTKPAQVLKKMTVQGRHAADTAPDDPPESCEDRNDVPQSDDDEPPKTLAERRRGRLVQAVDSSLIPEKEQYTIEAWPMAFWPPNGYWKRAWRDDGTYEPPSVRSPVSEISSAPSSAALRELEAKIMNYTVYEDPRDRPPAGYVGPRNLARKVNDVKDEDLENDDIQDDDVEYDDDIEDDDVEYDHEDWLGALPLRGGAGSPDSDADFYDQAYENPEAIETTGSNYYGSSPDASPQLPAVDDQDTTPIPDPVSVAGWGPTAKVEDAVSFSASSSPVLFEEGATTVEEEDAASSFSCPLVFRAGANVVNPEQRSEDRPPTYRGEDTNLSEVWSSIDPYMAEVLATFPSSTPSPNAGSTTAGSSYTRPASARPQSSSPPRQQARQDGQRRGRQRKRVRITTVDDEEEDPIASLLALIDTGLCTSLPPPGDAHGSEIEDEFAFFARRAENYYHGHRAGDGPFNGPIYLICQLLTALTWLAMLILSQPGNLFSTVAIITSYFILPLGWILALVVYYVRGFLHNIKRCLLWILRYPAAGRTDVRPPRPVLGRPSASAMVGSVVSLGVVFTAVALQVVLHERGIWLRANGWTHAYVRDIIERRPYPSWSPVEVDFRLAVMEWIGWIGWKGNVLAFGERYLRTW